MEEISEITQEVETALSDSLNALKESLTKEELPQVLTIFPLLRRPYFPGMAAPLVVEPGPYYEAMKECAKSEKTVALFLTRSEKADLYKLDFCDFHPTGVMARILRIIPMEQGGAQVILNMEKRIQLLQPVLVKKSMHAEIKEDVDLFLEDEDKSEQDKTKNYPCLRAYVRYIEESPVLTKELKAYSISIISTIKELLKLNPLFKEGLQIFLSHSDFTEPGKLADFAAALTTATREELQEVSEVTEIPQRVDKALTLLKKELDLSQLQSSINKKIEGAISKNQREFFLREQLKTIKKELGMERDDKAIEKERFETRLKERKVPPDVMKVIEEEMNKLASLEPHSAEYAVCRGYLDWLTVLPWGVQSEENHDLKKAELVLKKDHYGLEDIKKRILEFISVGKLSGGIKGSILCLVGPPGVGKTSIGKSIARALGRKFYRFSVGGMRDEAEIKGHRRTYVGAMPGKLIQALKFCGTINPVIMLDEVDKMGTSYHGDPASALLEVLDPEQNKEFLDHYLDVRIDLSNILFIVTANVLDTIPEPLKDRMEILRLSGYIQEEKLQIGQKYLIPNNRTAMGLKPSQVQFSKGALNLLIHGYARGAGVRGLENLIKKALRKVAFDIVQEEQKAKPAPKKHLISPKNIKDYLGKPSFLSDRFYKKTPIGVSTGLAWTALGGATLYVEAIASPSDKTSMKLTGQAGQVMKESSEIAWSYLQSALHRYTPDHPFFKKALVHLHIPEGATPKDGPSAGITMVTSLLSLLLSKPIDAHLGMTGELTLTGRILPIGGVKEKVVAARRSELKRLIFPKENERDWEELPVYIRKGIQVYFLDHYDDVFDIVFGKKGKQKRGK